MVLIGAVDGRDGSAGCVPGWSSRQRGATAAAAATGSAPAKLDAVNHRFWGFQSGLAWVFAGGYSVGSGSPYKRRLTDVRRIRRLGGELDLPLIA
jgi:hypothetical protein